MPRKKPAKVEEPEVTCPVCGNGVTLDDPFCPHCGAEFEEEEVEEIIEDAPAVEDLPDAPDDEEIVVEKEPEIKIEDEDEFEIPDEEETVEEVVEEEEPEEDLEEDLGEEEAPAEEDELEIEDEITEEEAEAVEDEVEEETAEAEEEVVEEETELEEGEEEVTEEEPAEEEAQEAETEEAEAEAEVTEAEAEATEEAVTEAPQVMRASLFDLRVLGIAFIILGIFGAQIAVNIRWYWTWVPAIESNVIIYAVCALAIMGIGILAFMMVKKAVSEKGKTVHPLLPTLLLSVLVFGIIAFILVWMAGPISDFMGESQLGMTGIFAIMAVVGVVLFLLGQKKIAAVKEAAKCA